MLKWAKNKNSNKAMSGAVKQRAAAPSNQSDRIPSMSRTSSQDSGSDAKRSSNGSATLSYPAEVCDDVNMNQVDGLVSLNVVLPNGKQMDITVDYNTPMRDLQVCLAGKSKLSPSGLLLQLLSEDNGSALTYKPNEAIGALGSRHVRLTNKKDKEANKSKNKSGKKPFEMTNRFTVNLPRGQKTVVRVSPAMTLGELMTSVCQDKDLDPRRHFLQLPGKPGMPIDLNVTIGQLGGFEISLVSHSSAQERTIASSMPDLSQVPTYMPGAGETKKKRGFLSFLKKDRKFKPHDTLYETSSTASHTMRASVAEPPPSNQRRVSDLGFESSRPKSMFVSSNPHPTEYSLSQKGSHHSQSNENIAPPRKKRKAPAPPAPTTTSENVSLPKQDINANDNNKREIHNDMNGEFTSSSSSSVNQRDASLSSSNKSQSAAPSSRAEMLSRFHSRNSSDSSGYHELTLSGCDSPEAGNTLNSKSKTSIDSASIESSDINNGADSGIHESPVRVSPIEEVLEKSDSPSAVSSVPIPHLDDASSNFAIKSTTLPLPSRKKKKAPAPPAPSVQIPPTQQTTVAIVAESSTTTRVTADLHEDKLQSVQKSNESEQLPVTSEITMENHDSGHEVILPPESFNDVTTPTQPTSESVETSTPLQMNEDPDLSDEDINTAFDIEDILNGVTFDDEPKPLKIQTYSMLNNNEKDESAMMMMETSSITSENIEQVETLSKSDRPCAFIPPPPPTEPPPPEVEVVQIESLNAAPVLIDKGTEVNDDNTSLAPASMKNSPEADSHDHQNHHHHHHPYHHHHHRTGSFSSVGSIDTIEGLSLDFQVAIRMGEESLHPCLDDVEVSPDGYKNEMALFVERMSKMTVEKEENADGNGLNDSLSSGLSLSETNSDTGSVIQHLRTDSSDSKSAVDSGSWSKKDAIRINGIQEAEENEEPPASNLQGSEEIPNTDDTVPPPPEFGDAQEKKVENIVDDDDDDEEEEYTETIEELVIPLGPNGFDFTAARKIPEREKTIEPISSSPKEVDETVNNHGVFRAEPVSIKPTKILENKKEEKEKKPVIPEKEEFILTFDDLSNVSFLPPRRKTSISQKKSKPAQDTSNSSGPSAVLIMDKKSTPRDEESSTESIQNRVSQLSFTPRSEPENDSLLEVKSISLLNRPTMRAAPIEDDSPPVVENYSVSIIPTTKTPASPDIAVYESVTSNYKLEDEVDGNSLPNSLNTSQNKEMAENGFDRPGSRTSGQGQDSQFDMLQMQFAQWKEQLANNQSILSQATANDIQVDQLQQLTAQMMMQQNMLNQIQTTMQNLQQQQTVNNSNGDKASSMEFPSVDVEQAAAAAEPAAPPAPPPPPPPPPAGSSGSSTTKASDGSSKTGLTKSKSRPKPKFERELDPREQLMIAIRSFSGREGLKSVSKKDTKWIHSNR